MIDQKEDHNQLILTSLGYQFEIIGYNFRNNVNIFS